MLTDNGGEKFSFCYVTDTVSALIDILLNGKSGETYNISNDNANVTMREFAQLVKSANPEKNLSVVFVHRKDEEEPEFSPSSPTPYVLCNDKIKSLGFSPKTTLKDGIKTQYKSNRTACRIAKDKVMRIKDFLNEFEADRAALPGVEKELLQSSGTKQLSSRAVNLQGVFAMPFSTITRLKGSE